MISLSRCLCPAGAWYWDGVVLVSMQCHDVALTLVRRCFGVVCPPGNQAGVRPRGKPARGLGAASYQRRCNVMHRRYVALLRGCVPAECYCMMS